MTLCSAFDEGYLVNDTMLTKCFGSRILNLRHLVDVMMHNRGCLVNLATAKIPFTDCIQSATFWHTYEFFLPVLVLQQSACIDGFHEIQHKKDDTNKKTPLSPPHTGAPCTKTRWPSPQAIYLQSQQRVQWQISCHSQDYSSSFEQWCGIVRRRL
jgi:hypothetical protein